MKLGEIMSDHLKNRDIVYDALAKELVGPNPVGEVLQTNPMPTFADQLASYGPWQDSNGQEILQRDRPSKRYGIGVLYPFETIDTDVAGVPPETGPDLTSESKEDVVADDHQILSVEARKELDTLERVEGIGKAELDDEDLDLTSANTYRPSSMAVSFSTLLAEESNVVVLVTGGRYKKLDVEISGAARTWWLRSNVSMKATFKAETLSNARILPRNRRGKNHSTLVTLKAPSPLFAPATTSFASLVLQRDVMIHDQAHPGRIHVGNLAQIDDGEPRRLLAPKLCLEFKEIAQGQRADQGKDLGSGFLPSLRSIVRGPSLSIAR